MSNGAPRHKINSVGTCHLIAVSFFFLLLTLEAHRHHGLPLYWHSVGVFTESPNSTDVTIRKYHNGE